MALKMSFDGKVGSLESKPSSVTYVIEYSGSDLEKLKEYVLKVVQSKGVKLVELNESKDKDGRWTVSARVRSERGLI